MYDAIVVGARCAGSPTAMLLARKGYRVLLLDRCSFPSDIMSTHYIHPPGVLQLKRWGLLDALVASGCPPIRQILFDVGSVSFRGFAVCPAGVDAGFAPRRTILDKILVDAAVEASAELRENFSVREIVFDGDRVVGVTGRDAGGSIVTEKAHVVIGADGVHSFVARSVKAPEYEVRPAPGCAYYSYWTGVSRGEFEWYPREDHGRMIGMIPTHGDAMAVFVMARNQDFAEYRSDIEGFHMRSLELVSGLAERVRAGKREERFVGQGDLPSFFRRPFGPGWALVGDAAYHKDPITGQGIADAFRDAELLANALDTAFAGQLPFDAALGAYEKKRNEAVMPMYDWTYQLATLAPPTPEFRMFIAAVSRNPHEIQQLFGAFAGTVSIPKFFSPENMQRIVAEGQSAAGA
ncbi:MAG TPA: NAD(P)/FAD-dependent oxidoreductase [Candidatus Limnocylindrales bacterium]|nr:NAD(P)/FAD-dependent oxidoreductase [Candidatus Limnocylindrales bacterium]